MNVNHLPVHQTAYEPKTTCSAHDAMWKKAGEYLPVKQSWLNAFSRCLLKFLPGLLFLACLPVSQPANAQGKAKKTRILFLLDASSSMTYNWNAGYSRFEVGSTILLKIMDSVYSINNEIQFAVRAYGTGYPAQLQNCIDTKLEVPFNLQNTNQIKTRLRNLVPLGQSPIAYSLKQASENELNEPELYDYSVIFITDGGESCNGDVCGVYQDLLKKKITIKPYIIGLDQNETLKTYYSCLGNYIEVSTPEDIRKAINLILDANKSIINKPKELNLVTTFSNVPDIRDTVAPVKADTIPVVRVKEAFARLKTVLLPRSTDKTFVWKPNATRLPKIAQVTIHLDFSEPKRSSPVMDELLPAFTKLKRKTVKAGMTTKKPNLNLPKKVSVAFVYEEAKKQSPDMTALAPRNAPAGLKQQKAKIPVSKNKLALAKKATVKFDYEEEKKVSPPMEWVMPAYASIALPKGKAKLAGKKSNLRTAQKATVRFVYEEEPKLPMAAIAMIRYPRRYSYAFRMPRPDKMPATRQKATLRFTVEEKKAIAKKDTVIAPPQEPFNMNTTVKFTTEEEVSQETMVQVFFKGTNGKTYPTAKPTIVMLDSRSGLPVKTFKREMNGNEPTPQKVPAGNYNLVIKGFDDLFANNIEIKPNTTKKVIVEVNDGTLKFTYQGNIKRPVKEYTAIVNRRFAAGATVKQPCTEVRTYEPGTYYIEVNTLPPYKGSIDLTFDATYEIQLNEPGTLKIMNEKPMGKLQIQTMLGDQFVTFYTMDIIGDPNKQTVALMPFSFKLVYMADPKVPEAGYKDLIIKINSNNQMELLLK